MKKKHIESCQSKPTVHRVNVFHMGTSYRFLSIKCETCKLQYKCHDIKHKREICKVSRNAENLLINFTRGRVSSFLSDDFYILARSSEQQEIKDIFKFLRMKYVKKNAR
jgi:hypothetical protein